MDDSHINNPPESIQTDETCSICLEDKPNNQFFKIDECSHRYCVFCMEQHARTKLRKGIIPKCPHENCDTKLKIESCQVFLSPNLVELMRLLIKKHTIPKLDRVYCPFPDCVEVMSISECLENMGQGYWFRFGSNSELEYQEAEEFEVEAIEYNEEFSENEMEYSDDTD
ncbi:E3 ubiquitin-protein ligase RSL1-like [Impatiens glandulifera]|uniref:E3 ubiquitin-protein ligase RSL1-like n=1 Tax=Impatiens glandulifera TaxID=253017 RepID=UPI001FB109D2|nr:E3 ubiquitin-protein ligase RSL1-like [Impatiens glandulifera]